MVTDSGGFIRTQMKIERIRAGSGVPYEETYGYCRAVRVGNRVLVAGSSALGPDGKMDESLIGDMYGQVKFAVGKIERALNELGLGLGHVVRTSFYVTDPAQQAVAAQAHADFFGRSKPAFTMVGIAFLYMPELMVEIDAEAVD